MNISMKAASFLWLVLCLIPSLEAQQGFVAAGGDAHHSHGSVAYSIGQVVYTSVTNTAGHVTQGLQQSFQLNIVGTRDLQQDATFVLYPNPANQIVYLESSEHAQIGSAEDFHVSLFDLQGHLLITQALQNDVNTISISRLAPATYFIQIWRGNRFIQSLSFSKTN